MREIVAPSLRRRFARRSLKPSHAAHAIVQAELLERRLALASFTVVNANDSGAGSLRQAITDANASATADTILFAAAGSQIISLLSPLPQIAAAGGNLSIAGSGSDKLTIRRNPAAPSNFRIFDSAAPFFNIASMTISGGISTSSGGAIVIRGTAPAVTLDDVAITGNSTSGDGGAIALLSSASLTIRNSTMSGNSAGGNGGAIHFVSGGSLLLDSSSIAGNSASGATGGGGIHFLGAAATQVPEDSIPGTLLIRNSTINNNFSSTSGGGIVLPSFTGTLLLQNSTVSGNIASGSGGGAIITSGPGSILLQNSTITGNSANGTAAGTGGGGLARTSTSAGSITAINSIIAANSNSNAPDILRNGSVTTVNANFSAIGSSAGFALSSSSADNIPFGTNLRLGSLANNGGTILTVSPQPGSPLINTASISLLPPNTTYDQRGIGFARVSGYSADIGALETQRTITVDNNSESGEGSLRDAITQAVDSSAFDTIVFDPRRFNDVSQTIQLVTPLPEITTDLTIVGPGASRLIIRRYPTAETNFRIFDSSAANLRISGISITAGNPSGYGGAILAMGNAPVVSLDGVIISGNTATAGGGGVAIPNSGFLVVRNSTISGNSSGGFGGGIDFINAGVGGGSLLLENSTVSGNGSGAGASGGGIYFSGAAGALPPAGFIPNTLLIRNSTIGSNSSITSGGGIGLGNFSGTLLVQNSTIAANFAATTGGGIALLAGPGSISLQNATISGNAANGISGAGGGGIARISSSPGNISLQNSIVSANFNNSAPDILRASSSTTVNANFSAIGSSAGFILSASSSNNLPFGTNLLLGPLTNNGGPTLTLAPQVTSPLINAGSNSMVPAMLTTDQRGPGFTRFSGSAVDIGALERDIIIPTLLSSQFSYITAPQAIRYTFSEDVSASLGPADLLLQNLTTSSTIPATNISVSFDFATNTASFTFPKYAFGALPDGNYRATLIASGVTDPGGNPLPDNHVSTFFFQQGDANHDGRVNLVDFNILAGNFGLIPADFAQADFNYDGFVNLVDLNILTGKFGAMLGPETELFGRTIISGGERDLSDPPLQILDQLS